MDTLQDAYRDEEEEDPVNSSSIQTTPNQTNPISQLNSTEINPIDERSTTQINNDTVLLNPNPNPPSSPKISTPEPEFKVDTMEVESSDIPTQLTNKSETIGSEDVSSDSVSEEDQNPQNSDAKDLLEEEVEDEEENPSEKKQKSISDFEIDQLNPQSMDSMTPFNGNGSGNGVGSSKKSYKKKAKGNNVWTKSTSRKGKKKSKNNNNNNNGNHNAVTPKSEDAVLITPVPRFPDKNDDSPESQICLSKVYKAEKVELSEDRLSAGSCKGYRMVRATRGVSEGAWYYEIKVVSLGETGHTRLGWSTEKGDLQAPVGYDGNSFGYRDIDGSKIHKALRENYGEEGYKEGDVIGCYINLPDGNSYCPQSPRLVWYKGQKYVCAPDPKEDPPKIVPGSEISFFKNGICQGVAYKDLYGGRYFPAASMYTLPNQPNCVVKFNFGPDFECSPTDFEGRPIPNPMIDVPYHGFDNRVENGELDENKE